MRIAVLLHGQPRHLEQGAWWFKNKVFPSHFKNLQVDYFAAFWDDGSDDLRYRIEKTYNPTRYHIYNYDDWFERIKHDIKSRNEHNKVVDLLAPKVQYNVMLMGDEHSKFARNFWGQFISCGLVSQLTGDLSNEYDIVIRTRSDVAFRPMSERLWLEAFENMHRNPVFDNKILADWMYIKHGVGFVGDFAFFAKPDAWHKYTKNMYKNCVSLATDDCLLWYDEHYNESQAVQFPHKTWTNLSILSETDWLSFHVVWPTPYASTVIRGTYDMTRETYDTLADKFHQHDK